MTSVLTAVLLTGAAEHIMQEMASKWVLQKRLWSLPGDQEGIQSGHLDKQEV